MYTIEFFYAPEERFIRVANRYKTRGEADYNCAVLNDFCPALRARVVGVHT